MSDGEPRFELGMIKTIPKDEIFKSVDVKKTGMVGGVETGVVTVVRVDRKNGVIEAK